MSTLNELKVRGHDGAFFSRKCKWSGVESMIYCVFCPIQIEEGDSYLSKIGAVGA